MKLELSDKNTFVLPSNELVRALDEAGEIDLKVLILLASDSDSKTIDTEKQRERITNTLQISDDDYNFALAFWRGAKVLKLVRAGKRCSEREKNVGEIECEAETIENSGKKTLLEERLPDYTQLEMAKKLEESDELKAVIDECQQIVGKIFSPADIAVVVGMSDRLGLSGEYISMLVAYCVGTGKKSLRYIEKTACSMYDEGIDNADKLAAFITSREQLHQNAAIIRRMTGCDNRALTSKEEKLLDKWLVEYSYDSEVVKLAYELTVPQVSKPGSYLPYMGKILDNWYDRRLKTADEVRSYLELKKQNSAKNDGFDADDFFKKALEKNRRTDGVKNYSVSNS